MSTSTVMWFIVGSALGLLVFGVLFVAGYHIAELWEGRKRR